MLRNRILPKLGDITLGEISSQKLTVFFAGLESDDAVSPKYGINIFGLLSTMFDIAHLHHLIPSVPLNRKLHRGKNQRKEKPRLSVDVLRGIVALAPAEYKVLFSIAISTGVRVGELIAFIWSDLDRENGTLSVTGSVWRGKRYSPKTSASIRTLRLSPGLIALLEHQLSRSEFRRPTDFIFGQLDGKPQDPDHLRQQVLYPILEQMGIERSDRAYGFHAFRHSAGSVLYKTTRDAKLVQSTLGHSNIQTTMDIYTHLDKQQIEEGTAILVREILGEVCYPFVTQTSDSVN
jgi:integrase